MAVGHGSPLVGSDAGLLVPQEAILAPTELAGAAPVLDAAHLKSAPRVDVARIGIAAVVVGMSRRRRDDQGSGQENAVHGAFLSQSDWSRSLAKRIFARAH